MENYFLTIDNGGTNTKVIIFDQSGNQIAVEAFPTKGLEPKSGFHEIDLIKLWQDLATAIRAVLVKGKLKGDQIKGIATVGHGKGLYTLDKEQHIFMNGILSADSRAEKYAAEFEGRVEEIFPLSHQHVMTSQAPVILRWLKDYRSELYNQIGSILSNKDFIGYLLTGEVKQEIGDASGNNLVNLDSEKYDRRLLEFFGITEMMTKLPPLIKATDQRGKVSIEAAEATGLVEGTPVFGGMFDIDACAIASASKNAPFILEKLGVIDLFDAIVDPATLTKGKPDPEIFVKAAESIGIKPEEAIGFEDAQAGIAGIKACSMYAIGILAGEPLDQADRTVHTLDELNMDELIAL